jgi:hypothetical protein
MTRACLEPSVAMGFVLVPSPGSKGGSIFVDNVQSFSEEHHYTKLVLFMHKLKALNAFTGSIFLQNTHFNLK